MKITYENLGDYYITNAVNYLIKCRGNKKVDISVVYVSKSEVYKDYQLELIFKVYLDNSYYTTESIYFHGIKLKELEVLIKWVIDVVKLDFYNLGDLMLSLPDNLRDYVDRKQIAYLIVILTQLKEFFFIPTNSLSNYIKRDLIHNILDNFTISTKWYMNNYDLIKTISLTNLTDNKRIKLTYNFDEDIDDLRSIKIYCVDKKKSNMLSFTNVDKEESKDISSKSLLILQPMILQGYPYDISSNNEE